MDNAQAEGEKTMASTIHIELGADGAIGTKATVTSRRLFVTRTATFVCHQATALLGAEWINEETGTPADSKLSMQLNEAAQAASRLAGKT
jgi:hypothetical protein